MGISASSLLDESKSNYIKGQAESELKEFSPYYRKQYSVSHFSQVEEDLEQHKEKITQLLKQREAPEGGEVLYEDAVLHFDETRKWRERYVVVRANYSLECHDSLESYMKGAPPRHKLLPTGGTVFTTEEKYMGMVDKCFPDSSSNVNEEFSPPLASMPGQFPVYLRLPYRRDYYFCFRQEAKQAHFLSILSDCIRHQNQDFLKKKTCEVQAFLKAIQLYRQAKGKYQAWDMMIGSDVRVMANLVMERLLPTLERDMLPRLKAKKTEKKRVWFATVEASYILVQEHLLEGLASLKKECGISARQQEVLIHSDMDQIVSSRALLEDKLKASVLEPAERFCSEAVQPYLASVLEELMEPINSGFLEGRKQSDSMMDQLCKDLQSRGVTDDLKKALAQMARPNLLSCYQNIGSLNEKLCHLEERFGFSNGSSLIHSAQIDLQQLMENAGYTFEQLLHKAIQDNTEQIGSAMEKARHRVLKQYDYDSSTVRKRIFQEALVAITLPHIKKNLASVCKPEELQRLEQSIYADHAHFVHVGNVYESILLQSLDKEITKVLKEAASLKKNNLINDSRDLLSQSSRSSLYSSSSPSTPSSPPSLLVPHTKPTPERQPRAPPLFAPDTMETSSAADDTQPEEEGTARGAPEAEVLEPVVVKPGAEVLEPVVVKPGAEVLEPVVVKPGAEVLEPVVVKPGAEEVRHVDEAQVEVSAIAQPKAVNNALEANVIQALAKAALDNGEMSFQTATETLTAETLTAETLTTETLTTEALTAETLTAEMLTTETLTTETLTTEILATETLTTETLAAEVLTTETLAAEALTTEALTTEALTAEMLTTETLTAETLTTEALTTEALTTEALTTEPLTAETLTTEPLTAETLTTEPLTAETLTTEMLAAETLTTETLAAETLTTETLKAETSVQSLSPETVIKGEEVSLKPESVHSLADSEMQSATNQEEMVLQETHTTVESVAVKTEDQEKPILTPSLGFANEQSLSDVDIGMLTVPETKADAECTVPEIELEVPSSGEGCDIATGHSSQEGLEGEAEQTCSETSSVNACAGSDSISSDLESVESREREVTTSEEEEEEEEECNIIVISDDPLDDALESPIVDNPSIQTATEADSSDAAVSGEASAEADLTVVTSANASPKPSAEQSETMPLVCDCPPAGAECPSSCEPPALDCIRAIRDLVEEVIEVEELVQRYPSGIPTEFD